METIELSIGTVKIKPLTNRIYNDALKASTIKDIQSNALFFDYCERKMTNIWFWQWGSLTISDGQKLREKIISMLKEDNIVKEVVEPEKEDTTQADIFAKLNPEDQQWFNATAEKQKRMIGG